MTAGWVPENAAEYPASGCWGGFRIETDERVPRGTIVVKETPMKLDEARRLVNTLTIADRATGRVLDSLKSRKGFLPWWTAMNTDTQDEIETAMFLAIKRTLDEEAKVR